MEINWLQTAVIALFAVFTFAGWHKGFLKIVISFAGTIVIIISVAIISPKVSRFITDNTDIYEHTRQKVINVFLEKMDRTDEEGKSDEFLKDLNLPDIMKSDLIEKNASQMYQAILISVFKDYISVYITKLIINAGSFVGVYIALSIALFIIIRSTDLIGRIPVIKGINKLLGGLTGAGQALLIVWVFFFIIIMFLGNEIGGKLLEEVERSNILRYLFNNNYLFRFIS